MGASRYSKRCNWPSGFTLIELMVVIVILGILATIMMPKILDRPEQARRMKAKVQIRNFQSALALFKTDTGRFPTTSEGLEALVGDPGLRGWKRGGYIEGGKVPLDPWGGPYIYICPGMHGDVYDLESYGQDGEDGGAGDDADIESWSLDQE
ncbi:MAG: type II secretion system protein GspG [Phycisphaerae bacterium SM1_79]|nr:MAG: type II secretion system protein GspG [Phycisphaerae bacterium SM1_79]